ncbi:hypothetical protein HVE01_04490 [Vreelandella venusta]|nr:hypothetical protein HVE01_04490 [Halomonas venusta]
MPDKKAQDEVGVTALETVVVIDVEIHVAIVVATVGVTWQRHLNCLHHVKSANFFAGVPLSA